MFKKYLYTYAQKIKSMYSSGNRYERQILESDSRKIERVHKLIDGYQIPIYKNYRYEIKPGWALSKPLRLLNHLKNHDILNANEKNFLKESIGYRTLLKDQKIMAEFTLKTIKKSPTFFEIDPQKEFNISNIYIKTDPKLIYKKTNNLKNYHKKQFLNISRISKNIFNEETKILEIGFESGGLSTFAIEKLGFKVFGIDNNHDGLVSSAIKKVNRNKKILKSNAEFVIGDISKKTKFNDKFFNLIYSVSVLEHIKDLDKSFEEMNRILRPGGLIVHNYSPYFSHNGAHALGIPDCPWGHVLMNEKEFISYLKEFRINEFTDAKDWLLNAVHRDRKRTLSNMQKIIFNSGFELLYWNTEHSPPKYLNDLTPEIINRCLKNNDFLSFNDLITTSIYFVAKKL